MQTVPYFQQQAAAANNTVYEKATDLIVLLNNYAGVPYTIWGKYSVLGADATDFGTATSTSSTSAGVVSTSTSSSTAATLPIASMTHDQILASFAHPSTQFAWTEYAAADYYVGLICASLGVVSVSSTTAPPICSEPNVSSMVTTFLQSG